MARFDGSRPGPGRPKGSQNKLGRLARENVVAVFDRMGGIEAMAEWAQENRSEFYRGIYARLLPSDSNVAIDDGRERTVAELTDEELTAILRRGDAIPAMESPDLEQ